MFDTTVIHRTNHVPTTVNHHEHRAPTDESVKLLNEFEKAAEKKLIAATKLDNNFISATYHEFNNHLNQSIDMCIRMKINGKEIEWRDSVYMDKHEDDRKEKIYESLSKMLALEILKGMNHAKSF